MKKILSCSIKNTSISKDRLPWVDNVKMVAMLFVILGHTWRIIHCPLPEWLGIFITSFNMPLFVMMTGYTSVRSIDRIICFTSLRSYLFKITKRILVPSAVFWSFAVVVLTIFKYLQIGELSQERIIEMFLRMIVIVLFVIAYYVKGSNWGKGMFNILCILSIPLALKYSSYWFLSMIWCVCGSVAICSYIINRFNRFKESFWRRFFMLYILSSLLYIFVAYLYSAIGTVMPIGVFVHFFLIGYALSKFKLFDCLFEHVILWSVIFILIGFSSLVLFDSLPLILIPSFSISLLFMLLIKKHSKDYNCFSYWGSQTLALYMVHAFIIYICYKLPLNYTIAGPLYLLYAIPAAILVTITSICIIKFLMRYEITRAYCLGEVNDK